VKSFLDNSNIGEDPRFIYKFIETYGASAFVCRYSSCSRSSNGFGSLRKREQHEALHAKRLKCTESSCEFYISGFTTKWALQRHNRKYHPKIAQVEIPTIQSHASIPPDTTSGVKHVEMHTAFLGIRMKPFSISSYDEIFEPQSESVVPDRKSVDDLIDRIQSLLEEVDARAMASDLAIRIILT
jgi:hypothetical protein